MRDKISRFMDMTGFSKNAEQMGKDMIEQARENFTEKFGADPKLIEVLDIVDSTFNANLDALRERVIDVYARLFPENTLDTIISFYESDAGKHLVDIGGRLSQDIQGAVSGWAVTALGKIENDIAAILAPTMLDPSVEGAEALAASVSAAPAAPTPPTETPAA